MGQMFALGFVLITIIKATNWSVLDFSSSGYQSKSFEVSDMQVKPSLTNVITRCKAGIATAVINFAGYESQSQPVFLRKKRDSVFYQSFKNS